MLELSDVALPDQPVDPGAARSGTEHTWRNGGTGVLGHTVAPRDARHAHSVLRGLTSGSGGMVAAATTGLPERADRNRNYDYR